MTARSHSRLRKRERTRMLRKEWARLRRQGFQPWSRWTGANGPGRVRT